MKNHILTISSLEVLNKTKSILNICIVKMTYLSQLHVSFIGVNVMTIESVRKPEWLKIKLNTNEQYTELKKMMREKSFTQCVKRRNVLIFMNAGLYAKQQPL